MFQDPFQALYSGIGGALLLHLTTIESIYPTVCAREEGERERERVGEIQQVSEVLLWKVHACCHDNIFALLKVVSLFKAPYRSRQEITYF